jgi:hypothetical protein
MGSRSTAEPLTLEVQISFLKCQQPQITRQSGLRVPPNSDKPTVLVQPSAAAQSPISLVAIASAAFSNLTGIGMGLPVNDVLRLTGGQTNPLYGSLSGTIRSAGIKAGVNSFLGTGESIVSLGGEASLASFGGVATTAATAAEAASVVGIAKFGFDALTVLYGGIVACSQ